MSPVLFFLDFDEQTADDWDVDMSVYYDKGIFNVCFTSVINLIDPGNQAELFLQHQFFFNPTSFHRWR